MCIRDRHLIAEYRAKPRDSVVGGHDARRASATRLTLKDVTLGLLAGAPSLLPPNLVNTNFFNCINLPLSLLLPIVKKFNSRRT